MQQSVLILLLPAATLIFFVIGLFAGKRFYPSEKTPPINAEPSPVGVNTPATKEQPFEEKLMMEGILKNIDEGTLVTDPSGIIVWANRRSLEILKTSWVMAGRNHISKILPMSNEENKQQTFKLKLTSLEGATIFVSIKIFLLTDQSGRMKGKIYVIWNATESMALEEMKLDFVAIAAHQLRTPLTSIRGYLSILSDSILPKLNDEEKKFF